MLDNKGTRSQAIKIANGESESDPIDLRGTSLTTIVVKNDPTGTGFTFLGSLDGEDFYPVMDATGTEIAVDVSGVGIYVLNPVLFLGLTQIKIVSNVTEAADVNLVAVSGDFTSEG